MRPDVFGESRLRSPLMTNGILGGFSLVANSAAQKSEREVVYWLPKSYALCPHWATPGRLLNLPGPSHDPAAKGLTAGPESFPFLNMFYIIYSHPQLLLVRKREAQAISFRLYSYNVPDLGFEPRQSYSDLPLPPPPPFSCPFPSSFPSHASPPLLLPSSTPLL